MPQSTTSAGKDEPVTRSSLRLHKRRVHCNTGYRDLLPISNQLVYDERMFKTYHTEVVQRHPERAQRGSW